MAPGPRYLRWVDLEGEVSAWELVIAPFSVLLFTISCAALSMLVTTLTPTRSMAVGLPSRLHRHADE